MIFGLFSVKHFDKDGLIIASYEVETFKQTIYKKEKTELGGSVVYELVR